MRNYKNIKAYQNADTLVEGIYSVTRKFPKEELYGIVSQLRRATVSVPTNIAEGASRRHIKDYLRFLYIARGSLSETEYLLGLSHRLEYLPETYFRKIDQNLQEVAKTLFGLIKAVEREST